MGQNIHFCCWKVNKCQKFFSAFNFFPDSQCDGSTPGDRYCIVTNEQEIIAQWERCVRVGKPNTFLFHAIPFAQAVDCNSHIIASRKPFFLTVKFQALNPCETTIPFRTQMESSTPLVSFSGGTRDNGSSSSSGVRRGTDASSFSATMGPASASASAAVGGGGGAKSKRFNLGRVLSSGSTGAGGGRAGGQVRIYILFFYHFKE